jgi:ABC-type Mn2+/Zn2+ transport system ATPase subunit
MMTGDIFIRNYRQFKTGKNKKNSERIEQLVEDLRCIFEYERFSIEPSDDNSMLHVTINGRPYKQHELGAGLSQFIMTLANIAIARPRLILIDEPELNLHPRLQLDFLTTLASYGADALWFTTHSVGLARSAADKIYAVQRRHDGDSTIRPLEGTIRIPEFAGEMSFSNQRELGFDQILLVEGPTEVKVFQHLLRQLRKDHKTVVLPLHGHLPDAAELDEVLRITDKVSAINDSERAAANEPLTQNRQAFLDLCSARGIRAQALTYRAIENYFPDEIIKRVFGPQYKGLDPYQRLRDVDPRWGKSENWKLAAAWPIKDVRQTDLGEFLERLCA